LTGFEGGRGRKRGRGVDFLGRVVHGGSVQADESTIGFREGGIGRADGGGLDSLRTL